MKKLFTFFILIFFASNIFSQTIFTYGSNAVSKDEFLRAYNKNKTAVTDKAASLREYLDLYIKFKLKVKAAQDLRIDTIASLTNDLQNFRTQIEDGYLNDESRVNALVEEAFNRSQKDIHVMYMFFPSNNSADPNKERDSIETMYKLVKGVWSDLGFVTVFNLPYEIENIVYALKPGEESRSSYKTKKGYYFFKNAEERKAFGKMKAAQILVAVPEDAKEEDRINAKKNADSVYQALLHGADFSELAKSVSIDKMTYLSGGLMPEFGVGKYDRVFENNAFALQKDGDITLPFQTKFGYHIVKRISRTEVPQDKTNDTYLYTLKQQVLQDNRIISAKEKFLNDVLKKLSFKKNAAFKEADLWRMTDSFMVTDKKLFTPSINERTVLFSFSDEKKNINDWFNFIKNSKASGAYNGENSEELMNRFISSSALDIYKKRLPELNLDFKYQLQEFKDGNMLFEIMERNVWTKASNDEAGLKNYYNEHRTKYTWNESADAILISCANEKVANEAAEKIKSGKSWKQIAEENTSQIQTDSGRYELNQIPAKLNTNFSQGMVTAPLVNEADGTATFAKIIKMYPANQQRSFDEARGMIINDYQNLLEDKWIAQLKKKYPIKVNEKVFQSLL